MDNDKINEDEALRENLLMLIKRHRIGERLDAWPEALTGFILDQLESYRRYSNNAVAEAWRHAMEACK
jgi:hypothetical protein